MKNHSDNSKCHPTLKKEKQKYFKKRVKGNKFNTHIYIYIYIYILLLSNLTALV